MGGHGCQERNEKSRSGEERVRVCMNERLHALVNKWYLRIST